MLLELPATHTISISNEVRAVGNCKNCGQYRLPCHFRGGKSPNYDVDTIAGLVKELNRNEVSPKVMVDASHGNSNKKPENQHIVCDSLCERISPGIRVFLV